MAECDTQGFLWLKLTSTCIRMIKEVIIQEQKEILKIKLQIYIISQTSHCLLRMWETHQQSTKLITSKNCSQHSQMKGCCKFKSSFSWVVGDCWSCEFTSLALWRKKSSAVHLNIENLLGKRNSTSKKINTDPSHHLISIFNSSMFCQENYWLFITTYFNSYSINGFALAVPLLCSQASLQLLLSEHVYSWFWYRIQ